MYPSTPLHDRHSTHVAWEIRRLAMRIHRLLNPDIYPDEEPTPAIRPVDSLNPLTEYPVQVGRRIGVPGPPSELYPPPPGESPPRMPSYPLTGRRFRPPPLLAVTLEEGPMNHSGDGDYPLALPPNSDHDENHPPY